MMPPRYSNRQGMEQHYWWEYHPQRNQLRPCLVTQWLSAQGIIPVDILGQLQAPWSSLSNFKISLCIEKCYIHIPCETFTGSLCRDVSIFLTIKVFIPVEINYTRVNEASGSSRLTSMFQWNSEERENTLHNATTKLVREPPPPPSPKGIVITGNELFPGDIMILKWYRTFR